MPINTGSFDSTPQEIESTELELAKPEVLADNLAYKQKLRSLPEVQNLTNEIDITNVNSIMAFGQKPSEGISQMSDALLSSMRRVDAEEASRMLVQLTKIMDKFDIKEIENPEKASASAKIIWQNKE